jgi:hypothetical protein
MLELHGLRLQAEGAAAPADWPELVPARLLYALIGALSYLQDIATAPMTVSVQAEGDGILLQATAMQPPPAEERRPSERPLQIDQASLACLAADLEWPMQIGPSSVLLQRPPE